MLHSLELTKTRDVTNRRGPENLFVRKASKTHGNIKIPTRNI
ncbi:MAG: hypothetical protein ACK416_04690 [Zestosphaera sp.]